MRILKLPMNARKDPESLTPDEITLLKTFFGEGSRYVSEAGIHSILDALEDGSDLSANDREIVERLERILSKMRESITSDLSGDQEVMFRDKLTVEEIAGYEFAVGNAEFFKTSWSKDFVHGPDTMINITQLARKILKPGEMIARLERVSWRRPIINNAKLMITAGGQKDVIEPGEDLFDGTLKTSHGRLLHFAAKEKKDSPVVLKASSNPMAESSFCDCPNCYTRYGDVHIFKLKGPSNAKMNTEATYPYTLSTLCEIVTLALNTITIEDDRLSENTSLRLMGGINNLDLPQIEGKAVFPEGGSLHIFMKPGEIKKGKSGIDLVPFDFRFPHQQSTSGSGILAISKSLRVTDKFKERCRQK